MSNFKEDLKNVKAFAFDVDGVFTDGIIFLLGKNEQARAMNIKDGFAVQYAIKKGFLIAIITGGTYEGVRTRFENLGVKDIYLNSKNKSADFDDFVKKNNLNTDNILYMGDDIPDLKIMKNLEISTCPSDAAVEIKSVSKYISNYDGGKGCVRDVIEQVLRAQGKWIKI